MQAAASVQVFISYKSEYLDFATRVARKIRAWGYNPWLDVEQIQPGTPWDSSIDKGLKSSQVVIGVVTPESVASDHVLDEWAWARENKRPFIPLKLRDVPLEDMPHTVIRVQHIDFTKNEARAFGQLEERLAKPATIYQPASVTKPAREQTIAKSLTGLQINNRKQMLRKVREFWIEGVLEQALLQGKIDVGIAARPDALLTYRDFDYTVSDQTTIIDVFEDMNRRLLILGAPGAGKTIALLELARDLVTAAEEDETYSLPIPVVFKLDSWASEPKSLVDWLQDRFSFEYHVPKKIAKRWVEEEQLVLLLDGLDEVSRDQWTACIDAINRFRQEYRSIDLVVCSRIDDYKEMNSKLNLEGAIILEPLNQEQIDGYLTGDELDALRTVMQTDPNLRTMAKTPFLLNAMKFAYRSAKPSNLLGYSSLESRRNHLFENYVERKIKQGGVRGPTTHQTRRRLMWLAKSMRKKEQSSFFIESLDPTWLGSIYLTRLGDAIFRLICALLAGIGSGMAGALIVQLTLGSAYTLPGILTGALAGGAAGALILGITVGFGGLFSGLLVLMLTLQPLGTFVSTLLSGAIIGLIGGFMIGVFQKLRGIPAGDVIFRSLLGLVGGIGTSLLLSVFYLSGSSDMFLIEAGLAIGAVCGTLGGVLIGQRKGLAESLYDTIKKLHLSHTSLERQGRVQLFDHLRLSGSRALAGLVAGGTFSSFLVLTGHPGLAAVIVLSTGVFAGMRGEEQELDNKRTIPNQGITKSLQNAFISGGVTGLVTGLALAIFGYADISWAGGLAVGLTAAVAYGGVTFFQHFATRILLCRDDYVPLRYDHFLDYAVSLNILRSVGGGYIFVHRYVQEYFASLDDSEA